jgi:hypothetical protein
MAVRKDATPPDISTPDAFKKALMEAKSIAMTDIAMPNGSGLVTQRIFNNAGLMDAIRSKIKVVALDPGQEQIAKGEIEIGFFNISEIRPFVKFAGAVTRLVAGVHQLRRRGDDEIYCHPGRGCACQDDREPNLSRTLEVGRHGASALSAVKVKNPAAPAVRREAGGTALRQAPLS